MTLTPADQHVACWEALKSQYQASDNGGLMWGGVGIDERQPGCSLISCGEDALDSLEFCVNEVREIGEQVGVEFTIQIERLK